MRELLVVCSAGFRKLCRIQAAPTCPAHHSWPQANKCFMQSVMWNMWSQLLRLRNAAQSKRRAWRQWAKCSAYSHSLVLIILPMIQKPVLLKWCNTEGVCSICCKAADFSFPGGSSIVTEGCPVDWSLWDQHEVWFLFQRRVLSWQRDNETKLTAAVSNHTFPVRSNKSTEALRGKREKKSGDGLVFLIM